MMVSGFDSVENIVGKAENAGYQHFLLFPQYFKKASFPDVSKGVIVWEWVVFDHIKDRNQLLTHYQTTKFWTGPI